MLRYEGRQGPAEVYVETAEQAEAYAKRTPTINKIGALKTDAAAQFLLETLPGESDAAAKGAIVRALGATQTDPAFKALMEFAEDDKAHATVQSSAVQAIGQFKNERALAFLTARTRDTTYRYRSSAMIGLQQFELDRTREVWFELLDETSYIYYGAAMRALAPLKDATVVEKARAVLSNEAEPESGKQAAVEPLKAVDDVDALTSVAPRPVGQLRDAIVGALAGVKDADALFAVAAKSQSDTARELALVAIGRMKRANAYRTLEKALGDRSEHVRVAAIEALGELGDQRAADKLLKMAGRGKGADTLGAIDALPRLVGANFELRESVLELLTKLTKASDLAVRLSAVSALGEMRAAEGLEIFDAFLKSRAWQERAAAILALVSLCSKESIDRLIPLLDKEEGRLKADVLQALQALTGKMLGFKSEPWQEWWSSQREKFEMPEKPGDAALATNLGTGSYYGVPLLSDRVTFCLDISGSMSATVKVDEKEITRLEQAKAELIGAVESLDRKVRFNLVFFDDRIEPWKGKLQDASGSNVKGAAAKIRGLKPRGGTNIYDTLETAMADPEVDTIFLMSDGAPGSGTYTNTEDILREIKKLNRTRRIVIHTVSLGRSPFMERLAKENGGGDGEERTRRGGA